MHILSGCQEKKNAELNVENGEVALDIFLRKCYIH